MHKNKKMLLVGFVFIFVFSFFYLAASTTKAQKEKKEENELVIGVALNPFIANTSALGKGSADAREIFQRGADEIEKLYGYKITLVMWGRTTYFYQTITPAGFVK